MRRDGDVVHLTPIEFDLLLRLAQTPHVVYGASRLLNQVWGYRRCRRRADGRLARPRDQAQARPDVIRTVHGIGYALDTSDL